MLTILKAINRKTINSECLAHQDMQEGRVSWQFTSMKCAHVSSIVTEVNHNGAVCLFKSSFETKQIFDGLSHQTLVHLSKNKMLWQIGHLSITGFS